MLGSSSLQPAASCMQIALKYRSSTNSGPYWIKPSNSNPPFQAFCDASQGWTLIMKIDGNRDNFNHDSVLWSNMQAFQSHNLALDDNEAKLASYWTLPFSELRLGMKVDGTIRWITFSYTASSLYNLIADGQYRKTSFGESKWRHLLGKSPLQVYCNKEGFHAISSNPFAARARLGLIANQENDCHTADSFIGFGTQYPNFNARNSAGNYATYSPDNGAVNIKAIGYIMAR